MLLERLVVENAEVQRPPAVEARPRRRGLEDSKGSGDAEEQKRTDTLEEALSARWEVKAPCGDMGSGEYQGCKAKKVFPDAVRFHRVSLVRNPLYGSLSWDYGHLHEGLYVNRIARPIFVNEVEGCKTTGPTKCNLSERV